MLPAYRVVLVLGVIVFVLFGPPVLLGTSVYPVAVVSGNSMFPVLHNGDLVVFHHIDTQDIPNGTIIVFVEGGAPVGYLDFLVRPTVIHEVIGRVVNQYGRVYYETKGVNNPFPDPGLTPAQNVVGTPIVVIPYVGFLVFFFSSPEGLVALIGFLTVYYIESEERAKRKEKLNRARFLIPFVFLNRGGKLSNDALIELTYLAEHCDDLAKTELWNHVASWLSSNLRKDWMYRVTTCDKHGDDAAEFYGEHVSTLKICVREAEETLSGQQHTSRAKDTQKP
ncbi:MAG: signal peptidase I [Thermoprotei archaeon]